MKTITLFKSPERTANPILFAVLLLTLAFFSTGSSIIPAGEMQNDFPNKEKRLNLLEKLEKGDYISSDEISSSYSCDHICNESLMPVSEEFNDLFDDLKKEMEEIGMRMGNLHDSKEFNEAMEEFRKQREEFKLELERVREEVRKVRIEIREIDFGTIK